jgi:hypothetical protein
MKRICSWCEAEMGTFAHSDIRPDEMITHGICDKCLIEVGQTDTASNQCIGYNSKSPEVISLYG